MVNSDYIEELNCWGLIIVKARPWDVVTLAKHWLQRRVLLRASMHFSITCLSNCNRRMFMIFSKQPAFFTNGDFSSCKIWRPTHGPQGQFPLWGYLGRLRKRVSSFQGYLPHLRENQNTVQIEAAVCPAACHSWSTSCMLFLSLLAASCLSTNSFWCLFFIASI